MILLDKVETVQAAAVGTIRAQLYTMQSLSTILQRSFEYAGNDWYIVGESYAGIYVPTLVRELLNKKRRMNYQLIYKALPLVMDAWEQMCCVVQMDPGPSILLSFSAVMDSLVKSCILKFNPLVHEKN